LTQDVFRGEPAVSGPRKAAARRPPSAWRDSACASPGQCSRVARRGETPQRVALQQCRRPSRGDRFRSRACRRTGSPLAVGGPVGDEDDFRRVAVSVPLVAGSRAGGSMCMCITGRLPTQSGFGRRRPGPSERRQRTRQSPEGRDHQRDRRDPHSSRLRGAQVRLRRPHPPPELERPVCDPAWPPKR
jgi:hypothetical protein